MRYCVECLPRHWCDLDDPDSIPCNQGTCEACDEATGSEPSETAVGYRYHPEYRDF